MLCCFRLLSMHCVYVEALSSGTPSATWHDLNFHTDRYVSTATMATGASANIFQDTLLHSHTSQLDHLHTPCSNQCSGVSDSVLRWCNLNCVQDNELSFYKGNGIWRQIFPLWSLVAVRFFKVFQHEIRGSE